jgi:putative membrane protein
MKIIIKENNKFRINKFIDWLIHMIGYGFILILMSILFESVYIDNELYGLWPFLVAVIVYILNKTIKPIIFLLTLPITGITLGIFYPFINVIVLKMVDFILGNHFETKGVFTLFFIAILISIMKFLMEETIIKPLIKRRVKYE